MQQFAGFVQAPHPPPLADRTSIPLAFPFPAYTAASQQSSPPHYHQHHQHQLLPTTTTAAAAPHGAPLTLVQVQPHPHHHHQPTPFIVTNISGIPAFTAAAASTHQQLPAPAHDSVIFVNSNASIMPIQMMTALPVSALPAQSPPITQPIVQGIVTAAPPAPAASAQVAVAATVPAPESLSELSPLKNASSASGETTSTGSRRKRRQRSAFAHELSYKGRYHPDVSNTLNRIRIWVNSQGLQYYDCMCGKRKPVQDLYKIKQHVSRHDVEEHVCPVCSKVFKHHLQMNAHMKVHKRETGRSAVSDVESDSSSPCQSANSSVTSASGQVQSEPVRVQA